MNDQQENKKVVWLASYPKSGATWTQGIIRRAGIHYGVPQGDFDVYKLIKSGGNPPTSKTIKSEIIEERCAILKTHRAWNGERILHSEIPFEMAAFVHIIRNPLDMLLSYINFTRIQYKNQPTNSRFQRKLFMEFMGFEKPLTLDVWLDMDLENIPKKNLDCALKNFTKNNLQVPSLNLVGGNWLEFNLSWMKAAKKFPSVMIRYEDCIHSPSAYSALTEIFKFSEENILDAAKYIEKARKEKSSDQDKQVFYNKMSSYYYLDFFSSDFIGNFLQKYQKEIELLGYPDLPTTK
ncbi:sulfotransferase domain-containing protein [uncultured Gilvimarinus sp.]|jgi:hypothetical protein|uniref:sulfotransferase domain-containing protein n=1 Tax=uncultured Gilvimarinus sp. TaxID=1689143 RepID=UPI0030D88549